MRLIRNKFVYIPLLILFAYQGTVSASDNKIFVITISDAISPVVANYLENELAKASDNDAACFIVELDTPGGLAASMRKIVIAIMGSKIPVVVYVSPSGARAASAGVMITIAADIAAMAPGTNIGAAHPIGIGGKEMGKIISGKIINDMVANARSIAEKRERNVEWVEKAIRESISATETEALNENIIDIVAGDMDDLIRQINGRKIKDKGVLRLDNAKIIRIKESIITSILKTISDPNIAYILLMIGLAGLYFELSNPGAIFPGVIGGIAIVLAFFSFQTLPVNYAGVLLIFLAVIFFILEIKVTSYGLLTIAGIVSLLLGSLMLFEGKSTELRLAWTTILPAIFIISAFFVVVSSLVVKSQMLVSKIGAEGLVGKKGIVQKEIIDEGKVFVHGELWIATAKEPIEKGAKVKIVKVTNLVLEVELASETKKDAYA